MNWHETIPLILGVFQANAGGFVLAVLGCLVFAWMLARAGARRDKRQQKEIDDLKRDLKACNAKHETSDRLLAESQAATHAQMSNLRMSISALFTYAILSGDRRLTGITLPDLLEGRVTLRVVDPQAEDRRESPSITPS